MKSVNWVKHEMFIPKYPRDIKGMGIFSKTVSFLPIEQAIAWVKRLGNIVYAQSKQMAWVC